MIKKKQAFGGFLHHHHQGVMKCKKAKLSMELISPIFVRTSDKYDS